MLVGNTKQIPLDTTRYVVNIPPLSHLSLLLCPFHPSTPLDIVLPFKQRKRDSPPSISCILSLQPQLVGSVQELQLPSPLSPLLSIRLLPKPTKHRLLAAPLLLAIAWHRPCPVCQPSPATPAGSFFCLFKNPVLLTQLPPPLSVSRASISSDLYSINTSIGHSPADSPIHLARQLDLFPLTALVFVRLFGTDLFPSLAQPSSLLENHIKSRQLLAPAIRFQGKTQSPPLPSSNRCLVLLGRGSQPPARPRG